MTSRKVTPHRISFTSPASNLVPNDPNDTNGNEDVFMWDRTTNATTRLTTGAISSLDAAISGDGRHVAFTRYENSIQQVLVWDTAAR